MMLNLNWNKCGNNGSWCAFLELKLDHEHFDNMEGVYVIWHSGLSPATVRVGQGFIRDRLATHRLDNEILQYKELNLFVTWAEVSASHRDGVERYLANQLDPLVGVRFPEVNPVTVNLPWE